MSLLLHVLATVALLLLAGAGGYRAACSDLGAGAPTRADACRRVWRHILRDLGLDR